MLALAASDPRRTRRVLADEIAGYLESSEGGDGPRLAAICHGYERELWLWLVGERTWSHCVSGLLGRVARRSGEGEP